MKKKKFEEKRVLLADSNFFKVFTADWVVGNAKNALNKPNSVVLTETTAKKYFGTAENAIGKILQPEGNDIQPLNVTAVSKDWPENSHFVFDILLTTASRESFSDINYVNFAAHTYLLLNENSSPNMVFNTCF